MADTFVQTVAPVVLRLICTAPEMTPFWNRMAALSFVESVPEGTVPPTALIEPTARITARAELEAFIAVRVFGLTAQELSDILDTFKAFRRSDERACQEFRTKRLILEALERLPRLDQPRVPPSKKAMVPAPAWMDRPLVLPASRRVGIAPDRYLVIGLPMRRAVDGTCRLHVAVWSIKAAAAKSLRNVLGDDADTNRIRALRQEIADALLEILSGAEVSWCRVMEDRPEIVVRRDAGSHFAWFLGKRALVLGCGALGSWAAEMIARAGAAAVDLVDNGIVKPGLLARQNFVADDIGSNKATAVAARLRALVPPGVTVRAFGEEAHSFATGNVGRFAGYDVVLDCTASHITQMKLERDWNCFAGRTPQVVSMVTDAKARQGLCVVLRQDSDSGPWDAYVRLKHRLCRDDSRSEILAAFYEPDAMKDLFQPEPGCSDPTFAGSTADASAIASGALNLACAHGLGGGKSAAVAFGNPGAKRPVVEVAVLDVMDNFVAGNYRVRIAKKVRREARGWVRQNNRLRSDAHETGGLLWGMWDDALGVIWVFDVSGPPLDSRHDPGHFLCGVEGTVAEHKRRLSLSRGTSGFIGFWHTHPDMVSHQSGTDMQGMATLVSAVGENQKRALMLIFGRVGTHSTMGIYVYESHKLTETGDYVQVGATQVTLGTAIV